MQNMVEQIQSEQEEKRQKRKIAMLKNPKMKFRKDSRDFDADSAKSILKEAFDRAMKNLLFENEINYFLKELKKKENDIKITQKKKYYDKARKTLELLMAKIGL